MAENGCDFYISRKLFDVMFWKFIKLQLYWKELHCYKCDPFKQGCEAIQVDATMCTISKATLGSIITPTETEYLTKTRYKKNTIKMAPRVVAPFVTMAKLRKLSFRFIVNQCGYYQRIDGKVANLSQAEYFQWKAQMCADQNYKAFADFLQWLFKMKNIPPELSKYYKHFIRACAQNIPLYHLIHHKILDIIANANCLGDWYNDESKKTIAEFAPLLGSIFDFYNRTNGHLIPNVFWMLLTKLSAGSQQRLNELCNTRKKGSNADIYDGKMHPMATELDQQKFSDYQHRYMYIFCIFCICFLYTFLKTINNKINFFSGAISGLPLYRLRPLYDIDHNSASRLQLGDCNKNYCDGISHTGGVFLGRCLPHGIPIHGHVIKGTEGLNDAFSTIVCLWKNAPKLIVSDISCQLCEYSMAREPLFFLNTLFMNDDWHGLDHKCGFVFRMYYLKKLCDKYRNINDQVIEQGNKTVKLLKTAATYMKKETFMNYMLLILEIDGRQRLRRLEQKAIY